MKFSLLLSPFLIAFAVAAPAQEEKARPATKEATLAYWNAYVAAWKPILDTEDTDDEIWLAAAEEWRDIPRGRVDKELVAAVLAAADATDEWRGAAKRAAEIVSNPLFPEKVKAKARKKGKLPALKDASEETAEPMLGAGFAFSRKTTKVNKLSVVLKARYGVDFPLGILAPRTPEAVAAEKATLEYWNEAGSISGGLRIPGRKQRGEAILKLDTDGVDPEVVEAVQALGEGLTGTGAEEEKKAVNARLWALKNKLKKKYQRDVRSIFWLDD